MRASQPHRVRWRQKLREAPLVRIDVLQAGVHLDQPPVPAKVTREVSILYRRGVVHPGAVSLNCCALRTLPKTDGEV
jgi:hypothetical protein